MRFRYVDDSSLSRKAWDDLPAMAAQSGEDELRVLVECLKNSLSGHDRNKQKEAELVSPTSTELSGFVSRMLKQPVQVFKRTIY